MQSALQKTSDLFKAEQERRHPVPISAVSLSAFFLIQSAWFTEYIFLIKLNSDFAVKELGIIKDSSPIGEISGFHALQFEKRNP